MFSNGDIKVSSLIMPNHVGQLSFPFTALFRSLSPIFGLADRDETTSQQAGGQVGLSPNNFANNGAMSQALIRCIVLYCFKSNYPQSAAPSYSPKSSLILVMKLCEMKCELAFALSYI